MVKRVLQSVIRKFANLSQNGKRKYLVRKGAKIGNNTIIYCNVENFNTEPFLVKIGDNCLIANGVKFIPHDGGVWTLYLAGYFEDGIIKDAMAPITIGNNVYIGTDAMIMPGVTIGDNVVIGARAVVTKDIKENMVAVGVPAIEKEGLLDYYNHLEQKNRFSLTVGLSLDDKRAFYTKKYEL